MLKSIQWKVVIMLILLILLAMQVVSVYLLQSLERYYVRDLSASLNPTVNVIVGLIDRLVAVAEPDVERLDQIVDQFASQPGVDVLILNSRGIIVSASGDWSNLRGERYNQLDVSLALTGSRSEGVRIDPETGLRYYHLAVPVRTDDDIVGVVHSLGSLDKIYRTMSEVRIILLTASLLAMAIVMLVGFALARTITGPIQDLTVQAAAMAAGDFERTISVRSRDEIGRLGETFNYLGQQLKETLSEISREKSRAEAILTHMTDGIVALDSDDRVMMVNPAAARMLDLDAAAVVGRTIPELDRLALRCAPTESHSTVHTVIAPSGRTLRVHVALVYRNGLPSGHVLVIHDVTEQENLERMRREFVANVSHELRTPLTTIKSYLETLLDGELGHPTNAPRFLSVALEETDRMARMVKDLLGLSQLDQGQVPWRFGLVDVAELAGDVVQKMQLQTERKGQRLVLEAINPLPEVRADRDRLEQVLVNLLSNAIEFTQKDSGDITVAAREDDGMVVVSVIDNGSGIPADDLPRIFERFYRVDKARSREFGGTGLGLAIAREIILAHGGRIEISSVPGKGTTVTFWIPKAGVDCG